MTGQIEPEKQSLQSMNIIDDQKLKLKQLFPNVFNEDKIDFEKLLQTLGDEVDTKQEHYGLTWAGKSECLKIIQQPSIATLKPCKEESVNFDDTENLFIEGDNLEVLKLLQRHYYGKVKMIYIDPPYNTGNEFIYPDKYSETLDTYLAYTGQVDDEGVKFSTNTETDGRYHSKWLNMMYPRLFLARNLLRDDGVIFISIDDNEVKNLRALCDEIFGEENFFTQIIIQSNKRGQTYKQIAKTHEYLLVYTKNPETEFNELEKTDEKDDLNLEDGISKYNTRELRNRNPKFGRFNRPNLFYPFFVNEKIVDKDNFSPISLTNNDDYLIKVEPLNSVGEESCWRWENKTAQKNININTQFSNLVAKRKRDGTFIIFEKYRKTTYKSKSIWFEKDVITEKGTIELGKLGLGEYFEFPKPVFLIEKQLKIGTNPEDVILDFFSGSCTTAHAIFNLNKQEDEAERKFIMVQLPEPCGEKSEAYKAGYKTIADIGKERIRRVIINIEEEQKQESAQTTITDESDGKEKQELDLGFKVFKLDKSNFNIWDGSIEEDTTGDEITKQLQLAIDHIDPDSSEEDILFELLLKSGISLTAKIDEIEVAGKKVYSIDDGDGLLMCLDRDLNKEVITGIAKKEPSRVICLDEGFSGNDQLKTNAVQIMKSFKVEDFKTV